MSVLGIASSVLSQLSSFAPQSQSQKLQQSFQQLAQDLQSGNLSQAQSDFSSLQQLLPVSQSNLVTGIPSGAQSTNPLATAVSQLAQDLKSGNLAAAQSDLAGVQQDVQQLRQQGMAHAHHHHHRNADDNASQSSTSMTPISTLFDQLGQSLQSGNVAAAQQAYTSLQQDFQQFALPVSANTSSTSNLSVSV